MNEAPADRAGDALPDRGRATLLVGQISDIHLGFGASGDARLYRRRLDAVLDALRALRPLPDLVVASGDLTESGDAADYRTLRDLFAALPFPVLPMIGNHDDRPTFREVFADVPTCDGFVQYVVDEGPLRLVLLDTVEAGRHGGAFCEVRAHWLAARLAEAADRPTLVFAHHPPIETGIDWMTIEHGEPWAMALETAIADQPQVLAVLAGHVHRPLLTTWAGTRVAVCPSTAPQVALDLRVIDPDTPDDRPLIVAEPPGFALHHWNGHALVSHFGTAGPHQVLARFDERLQPMIRYLLDERAGSATVGFVAD